MKKTYCILLAILLIVSLNACKNMKNVNSFNTTEVANEKTIHTTTEVITEPVMTTVPDTLPFTPNATTEFPITEPPATETPITEPVVSEPEDMSSEVTEPAPTVLEVIEPKPTQPKPTPSEPETTEPEVSEPEVTEPPTSEGGICGVWAHRYEEFTTILEPTTTSTGLEVAYCKNCGKEFLNEIPRLISPEKLENVDPRITIRKNIADSTVSYTYKDLRVVDTRAWGGAPIMVITEDDCLDIIYYTQNGTMVTYTLRLVEGYVNRFVILENGSYTTRLIGDYND